MLSADLLNEKNGNLVFAASALPEPDPERVQYIRQTWLARVQGMLTEKLRPSLYGAGLTELDASVDHAIQRAKEICQEHVQKYEEAKKHPPRVLSEEDRKAFFKRMNSSIKVATKPKGRKKRKR
jgi:hypothetical protein